MIGEADDDPIGGSGARRARHSRRLSDEVVEDARRLFQKRTERTLSSEDARQILENLIGFFSILHEWDRADAGDGAKVGSSDERLDTSA